MTLISPRFGAKLEVLDSVRYGYSNVAKKTVEKALDTTLDNGQILKDAFEALPDIDKIWITNPEELHFFTGNRPSNDTFVIVIPESKNTYTHPTAMEITKLDLPYFKFVQFLPPWITTKKQIAAVSTELKKILVHLQNNGLTPMRPESI